MTPLDAAIQIAKLRKENDEIHELAAHYREALQKIALDPLLEDKIEIARAALGWLSSDWTIS